MGGGGSLRDSPTFKISMRDYEDMAIKFYEHFVLIASAMGRLGDDGESMWDETDGFFYNVLRLPDGSTRRLKVRSTVGLLPLCAVTVYPAEVLLRLPRYMARVRWFEPTSGAYLNVGVGVRNVGPLSFTPPGNNSAGARDWVLVVDR